MIAITIPIATNTTIAICIHIHVGGIADSVAPSVTTAGGRYRRLRRSRQLSCRG
jgi:hypothetical protein